MKSNYIHFLLLLIFTFGFSSNKSSLPPLAATISGGATVCQNSTSSVVTFTGIGGTAPYTFTYTVTGTPGNQTIQTTTGNSVTVGTPTGTAGIFTYSLISVTDSQPPNNPVNVIGSAIITVNAPPTVDFTFTNDNACSGTAVQFTSAVSGIGSNTYSWDFGDGSPLSTQQNPTHSFSSLGCGNQSFPVTLTVTRGGCVVIKIRNVTVKQKPLIDFTDLINPFSTELFNNCTGTSSYNNYLITVGNSSSSCISSFTINWGDGNSQTNAIFPISHTYTSIGVYSMIITAVGSNGCINSKTYLVKNISNPLGGLNSPGSTQNLCAPTANLQFLISNWGSNSLDTTYSVSYGDGSTVLLTQNQLNTSIYYNPSSPSISANYPIPHIYTTSSCPAASFEVKLDVTNACGTTPFTLGNISILTKPTANFTSPPTGCVNTSILFTNTTIAGYGQNCVQSSIYTWNFGDGSPSITTPLSPPTNINHTFTTPGIYTVTLTAQNFCGTTTHTEQICIESPLVPQFSLSPNTGCTPLTVTATNSTSLTNQCSPPTYAWTVSYASGNCGSASAFNYTGGTSAASANPSFNFTEPGTYSITLATTNSCGTVTSTPKTVTVKKPPTVSIAAIPNFCGTANITPTATVNPCAPTSSTLTYAWSFPGGTPATSNAPNPGTINYPTNGNYTVSLVVSNECGPSNNATQTFIVNTAPVITNTNLSQTICSGSPTTLVTLTANPAGTTFTWTATATAGIAGFISSGTNTIPVQTITTTNSSAGTITYVIRPFVGGCEGTAVNYVINVNPAPSINNQPTPSAVCLGGTPATLLVTLNSSAVTPTYQWYSNTNNATTGGTLIAGATTATFNPPATVAGTLYYYCVISLSSGGCSSITSNTAAVVITPLPSVTTQPTLTQNLCVGVTIPTALSANASGGTGTVSYQWYSNASNTASGGTLISGATNATYTPPVFTSAGNYYYYATINYTGNGCGAVTTTTAEVLVFNDPIISMQPLATQTVCQNGVAANLQITASGGNGTFSYQWYSNTVNNTTTGTLITSATAATYSPPTGTVGTKYYYCIVSQTTSGCSVTSTTATVIINVAPTITTQPASSTICTGGIPTTLSLAYTNGVGTPTYQWFSNTSNSNVGGTAITGQTSATYTPSGSASGVFNYYGEVTFPSISGSCATIATSTAVVTVNPPAVIDIQPLASQSLCVGGTIITPLTVNVTGATGTITYQWYSNSTNSTVGGTPVGINSTNYTPPTFTTTGTTYYYVVITSSGNGCGAIASNFAQVIVVPDPSITTQPITSQTLCVNATPTTLQVIATGGNGTFSYQWFSNTVNNTTLGVIIAGATNATYTPSTSAVGTIYYYCVIAQSTIGCGVTSTTAAVIINQSPSITTQPVSSTVCLGGIPNTLSFLTINGVGTATYQWFSNDNNDTTTGTAIPSATSAAFIPSTTTQGITFYYCLLTFSGITGPCATIATTAASITILPAATITTQPLSSQILCVGGSIAVPLTVTYSGGTGTPSYQWYSNTSSVATGGTLISGANLSTYTPPVFTTAGSFYYYVTITLAGSGCGTISSEVAQIIVVNDPVVTSQPLPSQTLCENAIPTSLSVSTTGGIGNSFSYQWYSSTTNTTTGGAIIFGASNSSFIPPTSTLATTYYYCIINQVTSAGCSVTSTTGEVIITQSPSITNQPLSSTVCTGGTPSTLSFTFANGAGSSTYQWYSNENNDTTTGTIIPGETNPTFTPPATIVGAKYYYCLVTFSGITGACATIATNTAEVIITPVSTIDQNPLPTQSLCVGATISNPLFVSYIGGTGTPSYQWYLNSVSGNTGGNPISGATNSTYTPPVFTAAGTFYYYVNISFSGSGCGYITSNSAEIIIINDPTITSQPFPTQTLCQNATPTSLSVSPTGGIGNAFSYQWYSSATNTATGGSIIFGANSSTFIPPTATVGTTYYYCIINQVTSAGCSVTSTTAQVTVNPAPLINLQPLPSTWCLNQIPTNLTVTYTNGTGIPSYQWFSNTLDSTVGGNSISGEVNDSFTPLTNNVGYIYYYCIITFPALSGGCEVITSDTAVITVNANPIIASENITICSNNPFLTIPLNGNGNLVPAGTNYTWTQPVINPTGAVTGFSAQTIPQTEISQTLINTTTNPATVTYTITPSSGVCTGDNFMITVTVNPAINPNIIVTNNSCFGVNNASISTNITGGIAPYIITWGGPNGFASAATTISNIAPGIYTITIDDIGNCPFNNSYSITQPDDIVITTIDQNNSTCFQSNDANINISVTGGTGLYSYTWTKNAALFATSQNLLNLSPGTYTVSVTDQNNCGPKMATFTITEPPIIVISVVDHIDIKCFGAATGEINVSVAGGTIITDYNYSWSGPNGFASTLQNLNTLLAGTYTLTVTDDNACQKTIVVVLTQPTEVLITYTTTPITCYGANNASFATSISGGTPPYAFQWSNLSTSLVQNNLAAGNYTITVIDDSGCIKTATINIPEAPVFTVNPIVKNVTCYGANNGSINLNLTGGIAPVALTWNDGSTAGLIRNNLPPGTYTATISDGTPCYIVRTFTIVQPQPLVVSANLTNPTDCNNANSGTINLIVSGGTPLFNFAWSNGAITEDLTNLVAGNYTVTVIDTNGCSVSGQYSLIRPDPITIAVIKQTDFNCTTHQVIQHFVAQASGGIPPYQYQWSSGNITGANNQTMQTDTNGIVILTVQDSAACTKNYTVNVDNPEIGYASFESTSLGYTSYGIYSIGDPIQFNSALTGDYESIYWNFDDGTFSTELNPIHTYIIPKEYVVTQTVTYPFGCVYTYTITLSVEKGYLLVVPTAFTPNNDSVNDTYRPVIKRLKNVVLDIYDTWGAIVYSEQGDVLIGWDGKIKGFNAENGNYYSKVTAETFYGTIIHENQTFVLIK
ncbi:PKD domain-containing protein [Flavobacterium sp.]